MQLCQVLHDDALVLLLMVVVLLVVMMDPILLLISFVVSCLDLHYCCWYCSSNMIHGLVYMYHPIRPEMYLL